jgi:hypothetical protein
MSDDLRRMAGEHQRPNRVARSPDHRWRCWQCLDSNVHDPEQCEAPGCILREMRREREAADA